MGDQADLTAEIIGADRDRYGRVLWLFGDSIFLGTGLARAPAAFTKAEIAKEPLWPLRSPSSTINFLLRDAGRFANGEASHAAVMAGTTGLPDDLPRCAALTREFMRSGVVLPGDVVAMLDSGPHACDPDLHESQWAQLRAAVTESLETRLLMLSVPDQLHRRRHTRRYGDAPREVLMHNAPFAGSQTRYVRTHNDAMRDAAIERAAHMGSTSFVELSERMTEWETKVAVNGLTCFHKDGFHLSMWGQLRLCGLLLSRAWSGLRLTPEGAMLDLVSENASHFALGCTPNIAGDLYKRSFQECLSARARKTGAAPSVDRATS